MASAPASLLRAASAAPHWQANQRDCIEHGLEGPLRAALARRFLGQCRISNRYEVSDGDFFVAVPTGYDAYLLKSVVHDFDDDDAMKILRYCREAVQKDVTLLIIEEIVAPRQTMGNTHKLVDLDLLVHFGGKERTVDEYEKLLNDAGFKLVQITAVRTAFSPLSKRRRTKLASS